MKMTTDRDKYIDDMSECMSALTKRVIDLEHNILDIEDKLYDLECQDVWDMERIKKSINDKILESELKERDKP